MNARLAILVLAAAFVNVPIPKHQKLTWLRIFAIMATVTALFLSYGAPAGEQPQVVAQQLHSPKTSKKIAAVLWTRRSNEYTLQIVFSRTGGIIGIVDGQSILGPQGQHPTVMAWLLRADGTAIPTKRTPSQTSSKPFRRCRSSHCSA
jgi:hypothetical protein